MLGGSHARYADSLDGTAGLVGLRVALGQGAQVAQFDAGVSRFTAGGWALQLSGQGTALWQIARGPLQLGVAAGASLNDLEGGTATGTGAGGPMLAVRAGRIQAVLGASGGAYRAIDGHWSGIASGSLRAYWVPDPRVVLGVGGTTITTDSFRFTDLAAQVHISEGPLRIGLLGGTRVGELSDGVWGSMDLSLEIWSRVVLEASAGRYPQDVTGFTDGVYGQIGIRVYALRAPRPLRLPPPAVAVHRLDAQTVRVEIRYRADVATLAMAGDWNGWTPVPLREVADGRWAVELPLTPGAYGYALVADGEWVLPDGVIGVADGFGGTVARLIVPR